MPDRAVAGMMGTVPGAVCSGPEQIVRGRTVNQNHIERFTRAVSSIPSRREVLRGLAGVGFGLGASRFPEVGEAKRKRKRKKKKKDKNAKPNAFGCLEVGDPCKNAEQCCSGSCEGKTCRAHDTGTCNQKGPEICVIDPPLALTCNNDDTCRCFGTTAGSIACTRFEPAVSCVECQRDPDCEAQGFPPGTVCAPFSVGPCAGACASGTACLIPCGIEFPCPAGQDACGGDCLMSCAPGEFRNPEGCECESCTAIGEQCGSDAECCGENRCQFNGNQKVCVFFT